MSDSYDLNESLVQDIMIRKICVRSCSTEFIQKGEINQVSDFISAFDWLEEFRANEGRTDKMSGVRGAASGVPLQLRARTFPEAVALPGGCVLTANQYMELEGFRRNAHVNKW